MSELPRGWESATLAELIACDGSLADGDWIESKDQDPEGQIRLLQLADIGDGRFINKSRRYINEETFERLRCTEVLVNDVLIARMPDPLGRACIAPMLGQKCITVVDVAIVRPGTSSCAPQWLVHAINSPQIRQTIEMQASGTTRKRISRSNLSQLAFLVPPNSEQIRIADKLDSLLARVDACRERLDRVPGILKRFRQAVLAAATSGELTREWRETIGETNQWSTVELESVASDFSYGTAAKSLKAGKIPVLRMGNIQDGVLDWSDLVYTSNDSEIRKYKLHSGDVLFNRTNSPELVGKTAVYHGERDAIYAGYLIRVRCGTRLLPDFLNYCLGSPAGRDYCWQVKSDGVSQSNINARKLAAFSFGLPTVPEQVEIVRRVGSLFEIANLFERRHAEASQQIRRLTPSILAKAFRGELVPQDPNDEPASELLARIRDRDSSVVSKKPARSKVNDRQI